GKRNVAQRKYQRTAKGKLTQQRADRVRAKKESRRKYKRERARARLAGVSLEIVEAIRIRDKVCQLCGANERLEIDHIHPVAAGGIGSLTNLQLLCSPCNKLNQITCFFRAAE
ncbi:MAG: HNH endonuclease, partial [Nitrososphaera sp.]|nr:HNH endonuclease [Nitrososphaera sp.]